MRARLAFEWQKVGQMISIQKVLGKDDRYFVLLEKSAEEAQEAVLTLARLLRRPDRAVALAEHTAEGRQPRTAAGIGEMVIKTFVTAMDREDIVALADALNKIPKAADKFAERFTISSPLVVGADFSGQLRLLETATAQVQLMVKELRHGHHLERIEEMNGALQKAEGEADKLMLQLLRDLYGQPRELLHVLAIRDLYEILEKMMDRCRDAGNVVTNIVLKHS